MARLNFFNRSLNNKIDNTLNDLEKDGWSVQEHFFPIELTQKLKETLTSLRQQGNLLQAGIGR